MRRNEIATSGIVAFSLLLSACSGDVAVPEALAFGESEPVVILDRPVGNPCDTTEFSVAFDESVVLSNTGAASLGPFDIALPEGTYDVVVSSWLGAEEDPSETNEQWYFTTDSGYTSPTTTDHSPQLLMNQAFTSQAIDGTASVTLHHRATGTNVADSVHPLCVGFREVEPEPELLAVSAGGTNDLGEPVEAVQISFTPAQTQAADPEVEEPSAEAVVPELALTGPSDLALSLSLTGAALVIAGSAATVASRRSQDS